MNGLPLRDTWSDERAGVVGQRVQRSLRRRKALKRASSFALLLAVVGGASLGLFRGPPGSQLPQLHFADGSVAFMGGRLTTLENGTGDIRVRLDSGSAEFEVVKRPTRRFRVEVAALVVEVVGTHFTVMRGDDRAFVSVAEGHVRVLVHGEQADLYAGDSREFSLQPVGREPAPEPEPEAEAEVASPSPAADWRPLARKGEFERAYSLLRPSAVRDEPKELLLASDVARLSGHSKQARRYLEQVLERHPKDPRAPLAAFTLGRVLLEELGWPRDAALAFQKARALDARGPLAEDALAREVEAWSRAGEPDKARAAAELYLKEFPGGQRTLGVRRHGGL